MGIHCECFVRADDVRTEPWTKWVKIQAVTPILIRKQWKKKKFKGWKYVMEVMTSLFGIIVDFISYLVNLENLNKQKSFLIRNRIKTFSWSCQIHDKKDK